MISQHEMIGSRETGRQLIRIEHLTKTYLLGEVEVHALRGVSLPTVSMSANSREMNWQESETTKSE